MRYALKVGAPEWLVKKWHDWYFELGLHDNNRHFKAEATFYAPMCEGRIIEVTGRYCLTRKGAWRSLDAAMRWAQKQLGD